MAQTRNIIFIGGTQHGKSSTIQSILKYGNYDEAASEFRVGRSNVSETKKVTSFPNAIIPIKKYYWRDVSTKSPVEIEPDDYVDPEEIESIGESTGHQLKITVIDTPGLNDSGSAKAATDKAKHVGREASSSEETLNIVDERHIYNMLLAMLEAKTIHGVCFVINSDLGIGDSMQTCIKRYLEIFRKSDIKVSYHVAHTFVDQDKLNDPATKAKILERPKIFETQFGIKASHHFLDNDPSDTSPIFAHYANTAISGILKAFYDSSGVVVQNLKYPKSKKSTVDHDLQQSYDIIQKYYKLEEYTLKQRINRLEGDKPDLESRERVLKTKIRNLQESIDELDTDENILFDTYPKYKEWKVFGDRDPAVRWNIEIKHPIASAEAKSNGTRGRFHSLKIDGKTCSVTFQAEWGWDAQGSVEIFVEKRHMREDDIQELTNDYDAALTQLVKVGNELSSIGVEISIARTRRRDISEKIVSLQKDSARISKDSFKLDQFGRKGHYFLTAEVLPTALGYELKTVVPKEIISKKEIFYSYKSRGALAAEKIRHEKLKSAREISMKLFKLDIERKEKTVKLLRTLATNYQKQLVDRTKAMSAVNLPFRLHHSLPVGLGLNAAQQKICSKHLADLSQTISQRTSNHYALMQTAFEDEITYVSSYVSQIKACVDMAEDLLVKSEREAAIWQEKIRLHDAALQANEIARNLMGTQNLTIGQFTVLRKALAKENEDPWMALYAEQVTVQDVNSM